MDEFWNECGKVNQALETTGDDKAAEPHLVRVLQIVESNPGQRGVFISAFIEIMEHPQKWSELIVEFSMRKLLYPEVKAYAEARLQREEHKFEDMAARHILSAYEPTWPLKANFVYYSSQKPGDSAS